MKIYTTIDMTGLAIQNALLNPQSVAPSTFAPGEVYYDTNLSTLMLGNGTSYGALLNAITGTGPVTIGNSVVGQPSISVADANATEAGLLTAGGFTLLSGSTSAATASTLAQRDAAGNLDVATPTAASHAVTKAYVDALSSSGMSIIGEIDASTNPDYPSGVNGQAYRISVAGLIGGASGIAVTNGDMIMALGTTAGGDQATAGDDWLIMQSNIDYATELAAGYVRLATAAELTAGTSTVAVVTVAALEARVAQAESSASSQISSLTSQLSSLSASVGSLTGQVASFNSQITSVSNQASSALSAANYAVSLAQTNESAIANLGGSTPYREVLASGVSTWTVNHQLNGSVHTTIRLATTNELVLTEVVMIDSNNIRIDIGVTAPEDLIVTCLYAGAY